MNTSNRFDIETVARQQQAEISKELASSHLLKEAGSSRFDPTKSQKMVLRYSVTIIILSLLLLYFVH